MESIIHGLIISLLGNIKYNFVVCKPPRRMHNRMQILIHIIPYDYPLYIILPGGLRLGNLFFH